MYAWFKSYLSDRRQFVCIGKARSSSRPLTCGVPQGSVLRPIFYLLYTAPLGDIMRRHGISYHMYADDTQIYLTFKSSVLADMEQSRERVEACVREIDQWMLHNNLKLSTEVQSTKMQYSQYSEVHSTKVQYGKVRYSEVQYSEVHCTEVPCTEVQ